MIEQQHHDTRKVHQECARGDKGVEILHRGAVQGRSKNAARSVRRRAVHRPGPPAAAAVVAAAPRAAAAAYAVRERRVPAMVASGRLHRIPSLQTQGRPIAQHT
jgi:hypothetical protein